MVHPSFTVLPNRGLITITGTDRESFLQSLITNDINKLKTQPCIYACLLNAQGKFLHDFFITKSGETLLIDCEGGERTKDLAHKLTLYKLRANITIEATLENKVYATFQHSNTPTHATPTWDTAPSQNPTP